MSDIHFINTDKSDFKKEYFKAMDKKFEDERKKNVKKGKGELTLETFLDKEEKNCAKAEKLTFFYFLLPVIATAWSYFYTFHIVGNNTSNPVVRICVFLILSSLIALLFYKSFKKSLALQKAWIKSKRDEIESN